MAMRGGDIGSAATAADAAAAAAALAAAIDIEVASSASAVALFFVERQNGKKDPKSQPQSKAAKTNSFLNF